MSGLADVARIEMFVGIYMCVCVFVVLSWKTRHRYARFVNDEINGCRFFGQRKETWIYARPAWLKGVWHG